MIDLDELNELEEICNDNDGKFYGVEVSPAQLKSIIQELRLTREAIRLAKDYIDESPCDPDITDAQANAWLRYQSVITAYEQLKVKGDEKS